VAERTGLKAPYYYRSLDFEELWRKYPPAGEYVERVHSLSRDELHGLQQQRFLSQVARGWEVPFYQRHWGAAGIEPGDIKSLEDLSRLPPYTVHDVRAAIDRAPPFGDHIGIDFDTADPMPLVLQTSGGTTGLPRPMLYTPQDRETMNVLSGRRLWMQGVRPFDRVQVALTLGCPTAACWDARPCGNIPAHSGHDRIGRGHADASPDRNHEGLGHQCGGGFPRVPPSHGAGRPRRVASAARSPRHQIGPNPSRGR
jgi:phenylacetate-CoA ligase